MTRKSQVTFLFLLLGLLSIAVQSGFAQADPPLGFANNFFVTGDYAVGGVSLVGKANSGFATGTISIGADTNPGVAGSNSVPNGAQIVGAMLYWQTLEIIGGTTGQNGFFRPVFPGGPQTGYAIQGTALPNVANPGAHVYWGQGGTQCASTSSPKQLVAYRADVRGFLPQTASGDVIANGTYEVRMPSQSNGAPETLGVTLLIIYRVLSPAVPLSSIVVYDGTFAPTPSSLMKQKFQGFYEAAAPAAPNALAKMTIIAGNGQKHLSESVTFTNSVNLPSLYGTAPPFPGWYPPNGGWDNPTWNFPNQYPGNPSVNAEDSSETVTIQSSSQGCVTPEAIIFKTPVNDQDGDGQLYLWKTDQGYCDASINEAGNYTTEASCTGAGSSWVDLSGAAHGKKDMFVQLDYLCNVGNAPPNTSCPAAHLLPFCQNLNMDGTTCQDQTSTGYSFDPGLKINPADPDVVNQVENAFANTASGHTPVQLHVITTNAIQEPPCKDDLTTNPWTLCPFPGQPGVVGWPQGVVYLQNQLIDPNGNLCFTTGCGVPVFESAKRLSYHYALWGHALGLPKWTLQAGTLATGNGCPHLTPCVVQTGTTVTFYTSTPHGLKGYGDGNPNDPSCKYGRVTIANTITNPSLTGTWCVQATDPTQTTFSIVAANSTNAVYTFSTDPNFAVMSDQAGSVSGFSDIGGQHSIVGLGSWGSDGRSWKVKAGVFMHELGHSIGLTHFGLRYPNWTVANPDYTPATEANCKPNYQSVMNYLFVTTLLGPSNNVLDFSSQELAVLNENPLSPSHVATQDRSPIAFPTTSWFDTNPQHSFVDVLGHLHTIPSHATGHCDGSPVNTPNPDVNPTMYAWVNQGVLSGIDTITPLPPAWLSASLDLNFDGIYDSSFHGHDDWVGSPTAPGIDLRQVPATGTISAPGPGGTLGGGGGPGGKLGGGGGPGGQLGGGGGPGGKLGGGGGPGGQLGGGGGPGGKLGGGGAPELTREAANTITYPPAGLFIVSEGPSSRTVTLQWTAPSFGQIGAYRVYRSADGGTTNTLIATVPGSQTTYTDGTTQNGPPCNNPKGYQYFVTAVLAGTFNAFPPGPSEGQESVASNSASTISPDLTDAVTGCYIVTGPIVTSSAIHGTVVPITWTLQDDFYPNGGPVNNLTASTLVVNGPVPGSCAVGNTTILASGSLTAQSGAASTFGEPSAGQYTFNWDTDGFCAGQYTVKLILDSTQTTSAPLRLAIDVNDIDNPNPQINPLALTAGTVGLAYNYTLTEDGGTAPFSWAFSPVLPVGISQQSANSPTLSGTTCAAGSYNFTAMVTDNKRNTGTQNLTLQILQAYTTTTVVSSLNASTYGQAVNFTATVAPQYGCTPMRTVTFEDSAVPLMGSSTATLSGGMASFMTTSTELIAGVHSITAVYSGDSNFYATGAGGSTATALSQTVNQAKTATTVVSSLNASTYGQAVTFTATVAPAYAGVPSGSVIFEDGGVPLVGSSTVSLSNGMASFTTTNTELIAGVHSITAVYSGDSNFYATGTGGSTASTLTQTVQKADTTTSVQASPTSTTLGDVVTLTATVNSNNSTGTPTGLVTFFDNGTPIGTGTLSGADQDQATFTTSLLSVVASPHSITAAYEGDTNFNATGADAGSTLTAAANETVSLRGTTVTVALAPTTVNVATASTTTVTVTDTGITNPVGLADSWDPISGPAGATGSTATLVADGMVLVAGGTNTSGIVVNNAYIYNAVSQTFTATGNLNTARTGATATLLPTGEILIAGGSSGGTNALQTAELYNPVTGKFTVAGSGSSNQMTAARFEHTATPLQNGLVLIAGGENSGGTVGSAELYNPATDTFTATGNLNTARTGATATLLLSGNVLIVGGSKDGTAPNALQTAELYNPATGKFSGSSNQMTAARFEPTATVLLLGNVLIAGGENSAGTLGSAELYNPASDTFTATGNLNTARTGATATLLPSGMVLLVGGATGTTAELYDPDSAQFDATGTLVNADQPSLTATLLNGDNVLITGLTSGGSPAADAELYTPSFHPLGTVGLSSSGGGLDSFGAACVLAVSSGGASTCTSSVAPGAVGTNPHTITGTYPADSVHSGNSGIARLTVNP